MGIEYYDDPVFEKLRLKVAHAASEAEVLNELKQKKLFNWESESTSEIPSRVLNTVAQGPAGRSIVKTTLFSDTSSSVSSITIPNAYNWKETIQMDFDVQNLTAKIIEVNNKISNTASYKIKMIEDESEIAGIFQLSGTGLLNGMYFYLQITNTANIAGLLSMNLSQTDVKDSSKSIPVPYQDRLKAQQPHRVVINLEKRGISWLDIQEDGYYHNLKITNYSFNSQNRTVRIKIITNSTPMISSYKLTITSNKSEDFGVFKLEKTSILYPREQLLIMI
ncbi:hypothetical protein SAMN02745150_00552 [Brevinema andersonii]|uniref:Uncharacterized protein n=1 Tax=Brevinema andersonii TaxID=34097 RepID=A0A1I1DHU8_BREAD|nr:hypothetical protein [Brevinema andersonii]SFB74491.1 hypothetical protein SAMN02745150_00552 [Brevinema andersonii]